MELLDKIADYKKRASNPLLPESAVAKLNEVISELESQVPVGEVVPEVPPVETIPDFSQDADVKKMELLKTRLKLLKKMVAKKPTALLKTRIKIVEKMLNEVAFGKEFMASDDKGEKKQYSESGKEYEVKYVAKDRMKLKGKARGNIRAWACAKTKAEAVNIVKKDDDNFGELISAKPTGNTGPMNTCKMEYGGKTGCGCSHPKLSEGGPVSEGVDLFEDPDSIPLNVQKILARHENDFMDGSYDGLAKAKKKLEAIGYTFEYYLDGQAYDLRKIGQKGKSEDSEMAAKGTKIKSKKKTTKPKTKK